MSAHLPRLSSLLAALLTLGVALVASAAAAQSAHASGGACLSSATPDGEGEHPVYLEVWRVTGTTATVDPPGPRRDLLEMTLQEFGGRLMLPSSASVAVEASTVLHEDDGTGTAIDSLLAEVDRWIPKTRPSRRTMDSLAAALRARTDSIDRAGSLMWPTMRGQLRVVVHESGRLTGIATARRSGVPELDAALIVAARAIDSAGTLAGLVAAAWPGADSVILAINLVSDPEIGGVQAPLVRLRLPHYRVHPPRIVEGTGRFEYPEGRNGAMYQGDVVVDFDVTEAGTVDVASTRIRRGRPELTSGLLRGVATSRFRPARVGTCPVRVELRQPLQFRLDPSSGFQRVYERPPP